MASEFPLLNIQTEVHLSGDQYSVEGDKNQIQQVFYNVVKNAMDAMPEGGKLSIASHEVRENGKRWWALSVEDTGDGIPEDVLPKIFDPFSTTKPQDKGTSLGLSVIYGIVESHDGKMFVKRTSEEGTTFEIRLPLTAEDT